MSMRLRVRDRLNGAEWDAFRSAEWDALHRCSRPHRLRPR